MFFFLKGLLTNGEFRSIKNFSQINLNERLRNHETPSPLLSLLQKIKRFFVLHFHYVDKSIFPFLILYTSLLL